jgi:hypothetical protein
VKLSEAQAAVAASNLPMAETLVMLQLLRRADNSTLEIPAWLLPSLPVLAREARLGKPGSPDLRRLRRVLAHLDQHGWLRYEPGQGRGRKSSYLLIPGRFVPEPCTCIKGGATVPLSAPEKGAPQPEKRGHRGTSPRSSADIGHQEHQQEGGGQSMPPDDLVPCRVCRGPMDPVLPANGYRTHPACGPGEVSPLWPAGARRRA